ncbi:MAG: FmdB family transcriptional regulator [Chloroflexi bacterium]|nr:FmdB family transcriptional regulator [Chloroflexota bacterium]|tara:strand:- start:202 stop:471 length:270 start_codon:yes stop_codon:yes gene_type:complete
MPTYEFKNKNTGKIEEYLLSFSEVDKFKKDNPHLSRIWTDTPNVIYKGSGFYSTDYKSSSNTKNKKSESKESSTKEPSTKEKKSNKKSK